MKNVIYLGLLLIALILLIIIGSFGFLAGCVYLFFSVGTGRIDRVGDYFLQVAIIFDICGNVICQNTFNGILIKNNSQALFGHPGETISSVLGKNERDGTLTKLGRFFANLLNRIQKDHCKNSINE